MISRIALAGKSYCSWSSSRYSCGCLKLLLMMISSRGSQVCIRKLRIAAWADLIRSSQQVSMMQLTSGGAVSGRAPHFSTSWIVGSVTMSKSCSLIRLSGSLGAINIDPVFVTQDRPEVADLLVGHAAWLVNPTAPPTRPLLAGVLTQKAFPELARHRAVAPA